MRGRAVAVGVISLLLGLLWLLAGGVSGWAVYDSCSQQGGAAAVLAVAGFAPPLLLCAIGLAFLVNRPIALVLLPVPLVSWVVLWLAAQGISIALGVPAFECIVPGDGPPGGWDYSLWLLTFSLSLLGAVGVPLLGGLFVAGLDPAAVARSRDLLATTFTGRRVVRGLAIAAVAAAALLLVGLLWPVTLDERALVDGSRSHWEAPATASHYDRLRTWKIRFSLLRGGGFRLLGPDLERRLGPLQWGVGRVYSDLPYDFLIAFVSATGHFPDASYRPSYQRRRGAFETCKEQVGSDEGFIREWSRSVAGLLTPDEISWTAAVFRRDEFALVRRYERHSADWCSTEDITPMQEQEAWRELGHCQEREGSAGGYPDYPDSCAQMFVKQMQEQDPEAWNELVRCQEREGSAGGYPEYPDSCTQMFVKQLEVETMEPRPPGQLIAAWKRDTSDLLEAGEWTRLAASLSREGFLGLERTCWELLLNRFRQGRGGTTPDYLTRYITVLLDEECAELNPGSEEEFSRVVFEWECAGLRCHWRSIDVAAWQRALPLPCRTTGTAACLDEALDYLARGRFGGAP